MDANEDFPYPPRLTLPPRGEIPAIPRFGTLTIVDIGSSGRAVDAWTEGARAALMPVDLVPVSNAEPGDWWQRRHSIFAEVAVGRFVGWRLAIAGPEYAVLALQAVALQSGLLPTEVLVHSEPDPRQWIYCPHCTQVSLVDSRMPIECAGCHHSLYVHDHYNAAGGLFLASVRGAS